MTHELTGTCTASRSNDRLDIYTKMTGDELGPKLIIGQNDTAMTIPLRLYHQTPSSMIVPLYAYKDDTNVRYPLFSFFGTQYSCGDGRESKDRLADTAK